MVKTRLGASTACSLAALQRLPRAARTFVVAVIASGAAALVFDLATLQVGAPVLFVQLLALAVATSTVKISVPLARSRSSLSLSFAITLAGVAILDGTAACLIGMASAWTQCTFRMKARNPGYRTLFSIAMVGLSVHVALLMFHWAGGADPTTLMGTARPILCAALGYFVVNSALLAGAVALTTGQPVLKVWREDFLWSAATYLLAGCAAVLAVLAAKSGSYGWALALSVPLYLSYQSYRSFVGRLEQEQEQVRRVSDVQLATIEALALAIEIKDGTSYDHVRQIQRYAEELARAVRMPESEIPGLKTAALLHDIGHLAVPEHILVKTSELSPEEFQRVKIHPKVGAEIVEGVPFPYPVAPLILSHHERWDGAGYPLGLSGEAIPLGARILAVVDCFTALRADRPYRPAREHHEAIAILQEQAGGALDPKLVSEFLELLPHLQTQENGATDLVQSAPDPALSPAPTAGSAFEHIMAAHREAKVLYDIAEELGTSLSLESAMSLLAAKLPLVLPFSCGALFLRDIDTGRFRCRCAIGHGEEWVRQAVVADGADLIAQLPIGAVDALPLRSAMTSPLMSGGHVIGLLAVYATAADAYGDDHRRLLERVSQQAASVTANALVFEQLHEASLTDALTGLGNRRALHQALHAFLPRAERDHARASVLVLDVNELKHLNDTYGHDVGDRALRHVGSLLGALRRGTDLCVRYGGDEFVAVLWNCGAADAEARRAELQRTIDEATFLVRAGVSAPLSVSAGAATFPDDGLSADALLTVADQRMYVDKALRRRSRAATPDTQSQISLPLAV
jgi:diguanylate cyclase (GGDEF)-like protein/putative nucleotidyltransferase with HDIG domain